VQQARDARWQRYAITAAGGGCESLLELTLVFGRVLVPTADDGLANVSDLLFGNPRTAMAVRADIGPSPSARARAGRYAISERMELVTGIKVDAGAI
jgi:hypothetical protein